MSDFLSDTNSELYTYRYETGFKSSNIAYIIETHNNNHSYDINDRHTPDDSLRDFGARKVQHDITTKCLTCGMYINMAELKDHVAYHDALTNLNFKDLPANLKVLMDRRKHLIKTCSLKHLTNMDLNLANLNEWEHTIKQINSSFELIKSYLTLTHEENRKYKNELKIDVQAESFIPSNPSITAISSCSNQNITFQKFMEDNHKVIDEFGKNPNRTYVGVFDGYEGSVSSELCADQLHFGLVKNLSKFDTSMELKLDFKEYDEINHLDKYEIPIHYQNEQANKANNASDDDEDDTNDKHLKNIRNAFYSTYKQMDKLLSRGKNEKSRVRWSGATGATCFIEHIDENNTWLHMANCGNVEALLLYNRTKDDEPFKYKVVTRLHSLNADEKEKERLEKAGCRIVESSKGQYKIESIFDMTRAFGFHGDKSVKRFICSVPSVKSIKIDKNCAAVVLGTKGLWNTLSYKKVANLVLQMLPINFIANSKIPDPSVLQLLGNKSGPNQEQTSAEKKDNNDSFKANNNRASTNEYVLRHSKDYIDMSVREIDENNDEDDGEYINYYSNFKNILEAHARPKTAPFFSSRATKANTFEFDDNYEKISPIKASSDIYPMSANRADTDRPISIDYFDTIYFSSINKDTKEDETLACKQPSFVKQTCNEFVQVDKFEIHEALRYLMSPISRHRLEFADMICRKLVISALMAGSSDNITCSCVFFKGSGI